MNNFKLIREIYGATQDEIATAIGVNRATVSNWETGVSKASSSSLEKLSIYYGIGPECFYEVEIDEVRRQMLINNAKKAKQIESEGKKVKAEDFSKIFENLDFNEAVLKYMYAMKMLLASADMAKLEDLKNAYLINEKMGKRLHAIIQIREAEERAKKENDEATLYDLLDDLSSSLDKE